MYIYIYIYIYIQDTTPAVTIIRDHSRRLVNTTNHSTERHFFIDNLLLRILDD